MLLCEVLEQGTGREGRHKQTSPPKIGSLHLLQMTAGPGLETQMLEVCGSGWLQTSLCVETPTETLRPGTPLDKVPTLCSLDKETLTEHLPKHFDFLLCVSLPDVLEDDDIEEGYLWLIDREIGNESPPDFLDRQPLWCCLTPVREVGSVKLCWNGKVLTEQPSFLTSWYDPWVDPEIKLPTLIDSRGPDKHPTLGWTNLSIVCEWELEGTKFGPS